MKMDNTCMMIMLRNPETAGTFVNDITPLQSNFDIGRGRRSVDAKSILGILTFDLSQPFELRFTTAPGEDGRIRDIIGKYAA